MARELHLDVSRLLDANRPRALQEQERVHLDRCEVCRRAYEVRSEALAVLGGDALLPSQPQSEAMLQAIFERALPPQPKRLRLTSWLAPALAAGAAVLIGLVVHQQRSAGPAAESVSTPASFVSRGEKPSKNIGISLFCQHNKQITALSGNGTCSTQGSLAATVFSAEPLEHRAFLFAIDGAGTVHRARYKRVGDARQGVAVTGDGQQVLDAWIELGPAAPGRAELVLVLCRACSAEAAESVVRSPASSATTLNDSLVQRMPVQISEQIP